MNTRFLFITLFSLVFLAACGGTTPDTDMDMDDKDAAQEDMMDKDHMDDMDDDKDMDDDDALPAGTTKTDTDKDDQAGATTSPFASKNEWRSKASESSLTFFGSSPVSEHPGAFQTFEAALKFDSAHPGDMMHATLEVSIDIASVKTDSSGLDGHLQAEEYFHAAAFPTAMFTSKTIKAGNDGAYMITGDLTIKGTTQSATLRANINGTTMTASYGIPREDFAIGTGVKAKAIASVIPIEATVVFE